MSNLASARPIIRDEASDTTSQTQTRAEAITRGVAMSKSAKHQHVFLGPIARRSDQPVAPVAEIVFSDDDGQRAKEQGVPAKGWIQLVPGDACSGQNERAAEDKMMTVVVSTAGLDNKNVACRVTGFISEHHADIAVGYGTTLAEEYQGATFVVKVDPSNFDQMEQDLPEFEDAMNREYEATDHTHQAAASRRFDVTIIVKKNRPGEFHKATAIIAKYNANIRSMMGGPFKTKDNAGVNMPAENIGAISIQIDVEAESADEVVAAIRRDMEAEPGWFTTVREQVASTRRASGGGRNERRGPSKPVYNRAEDIRREPGTVQRASHYIVEAEHFGP
jgi:glycine cleavage system regulatory protein